MAQGRENHNVNISLEAKDRRKNPVKNFLEQSQSQRQLLLQQTVNAVKPPLDPGAAHKLNMKSIPNTSIQNTPTLNIEWVSQENLRPPTSNPAEAGSINLNDRPEFMQGHNINSQKKAEAQANDQRHHDLMKKSPQLNAMAAAY